MPKKRTSKTKAAQPELTHINGKMLKTSHKLLKKAMVDKEIKLGEAISNAVECWVKNGCPVVV